jgi:hypothetical protein
MTTNSTPGQSADPVILIARQLGEASTKVDQLDAAAVAAKEGDQRNRLRARFATQDKRVDELALAACLAQAQTLEGAQAQLTIAAGYTDANALRDFAYGQNIRAAIASAVVVLERVTGKSGIDLGLHRYVVPEDDGADAEILRLAAEWREVIAANDKAFDATQRPDEGACARMRAIEAVLVDLPAVTIDGVIAKLKPILLDDMGERGKLLDRAILDLERLAGGAT